MVFSTYFILPWWRVAEEYSKNRSQVQAWISKDQTLTIGLVKKCDYSCVICSIGKLDYKGQLMVPLSKLYHQMGNRQPNLRIQFSDTSNQPNWLLKNH